ncbi:MAG TPA: adenylate/guanylate cyclase domain-containing protein [Chitinophagaceae bacterium]|nr:adenylate/guanylate cyclase domain-containing protein [Chitinophagaceae bacterium]
MQLKRKAYYFLISFLFLTSINAAAQDQKIADSLARIFQLDTASDQGKLELLRNLAFNESKDLKSAVQYADELIRLSLKTNNPLYLHRGYFQKGNKMRMLGNLEEALDNYFKSSEAAKKADFLRGEGSAYGAIADVYSVSKNHNNAMLYYNKAIATLRKASDSIALAAAISNAGDDYLNNKIYDSALLYFKESEIIFEKVDYLVGKAYSLGNIGMVYANLGDERLAEKNINEAIRILEESEDYYPICVYLISMADIYEEKGDKNAALDYALRSLQLAQQYGLKEQISNANLKLSQLYEKTGNNNESFKYYKNHIVYRDSLNDLNSVQKMADLRTNYEVSQKQVEVDLLAQKSRNQKLLNQSLFITLGLGLIILGTLYWYYRAIAREKKISESLLLNILPAETAKELKQNGKVSAVKFDSVTVLFTDFVQFTKVAEHVEPEQLVKSIDFYFKGFDVIITKYGLEKIKTVGDSYMCASGLPTVTDTHARNVIIAASEMIELVRSESNADDELIHFEIRIGVHTGPVVAGIVGLKKWQYDIWGDTVNIASRMESNSIPGRVNLSETTYQQVKDEFACEYRGDIEIKNHGSMKMYFLSV